VIDCWYDSGAMPFAQWGYRGDKPLPSPPRKGEGTDMLGAAANKFHDQFPADFISEALDQTRGWFYSQLAISTLLFSREHAAGSGEQEASGLPAPRSMLHAPYPHPFRNCIVLGLMLGEDGQKMSKSKRNYREPNEIFDRYGADALRWFFFANQPPWTTIRYSEQAIKESIPEFLLRLWNVYSFFVIYANIDGFDPAEECSRGVEEQRRRGAEKSEGAKGYSTTPLLHFASFDARSYRTIGERSELDRWILSELSRTCAAVVERMDAYDNFGAAQHITEFVNALSNWYVRRSRDRFWAADKRSTDKLDAYWTLYEALVTTTKLIAPFVPFLAETLWQNLAHSVLGDRAPKSVHLAEYPTGDAAAIDEKLSARMNLVREIASLGRSARNTANLKVRQPLAKVEVVLADTSHQAWLEEHAGLIAEELNVKAVEFTTHGEQYITYSVVPNFKRLGPRIGKNLPAVKKLLGEIDAARLLAVLKSDGKVDLNLPDGGTVTLDNEDIEVRLQAKEGWAAAQGKGCVVVLATELTPELVAEGLARDVVRLIQDQRKEIACQYTDRIELGLVTQSAELSAAIAKFREYLAQETLANKVVDQPISGVESVSAKVLGHDLMIYLRVVT
jgi:isoleucyl-tRNA synthetase